MGGKGEMVEMVCTGSQRETSAPRKDEFNFLWNGSSTPTIQGVSRLQGIIAGGDFLGLCDQKSSYKHVSDFGRLRSYDRLKLRIEGKDY